MVSQGQGHQQVVPRQVFQQQGGTPPQLQMQQRVMPLVLNEQQPLRPCCTHQQQQQQQQPWGFVSMLLGQQQQQAHGLRVQQDWQDWGLPQALPSQQPPLVGQRATPSTQQQQQQYHEPMLLPQQRSVVAGQQQDWAMPQQQQQRLLPVQTQQVQGRRQLVAPRTRQQLPAAQSMHTQQQEEHARLEQNVLDLPQQPQSTELSPPPPLQQQQQHQQQQQERVAGLALRQQQHEEEPQSAREPQAWDDQQQPWQKGPDDGVTDHARKRVRSPAADPAVVVDALHVVLQHLGSADGDQQLYQVAARGLHRTSKQLQASCRATLSELCLDLYYKGMVSMYPEPVHPPSLIPWDVLAACPAVTSWKLAPQQLGCFDSEEAAAAASNLRQLEVLLWGSAQFHASDEQLAGLGRLLRAAPKLEEVDVCCKGDSPWLILDPSSSSLETANPPALPLRSWRSPGELHSVLPHWVARQPQLSCTLRHVDLDYPWAYSSSAIDVNSLAGLTGLQDLKLGRIQLPLPPQIASMSNLSSLQLPAQAEALAAVSAVTSLRSLSWSALHDSCWVSSSDFKEVRSSYSALKQLQCLEVHGDGATPLHPDLGVWLPGLVRLKLNLGCVTAVPEGLTRLTSLVLEQNRSEQLTLPRDITGLKQLSLPFASCTAMAGLSCLSGLELLDVSRSGALGSSLAGLQPLSALRHLNIECIHRCDRASLTVLAALQQLTYLNVNDLLNRKEAIASLVPLPSLRELHIKGSGQFVYAGRMSDQVYLDALGPWLMQMPGITKLVAGHSYLDDQDEMYYLPAGLQELELTHMKHLRYLRKGLRRLSALRVLDLTGNKLWSLPDWLRRLRCLEVIWFGGDTSFQKGWEVFAHMPNLRSVSVLGAARVLSGAPHLHFGRLTRSPF
jgi:hypothetical protein